MINYTHSYGCPINMANQTMATQAAEGEPPDDGLSAQAFVSDKRVYHVTYDHRGNPIFSSDHDLNWRAIIWVQRSSMIWLLQATIAVPCLLEALLLVYLTNKVCSCLLAFSLFINLR